MSFVLKNRQAVVTGASAGIGEALAEELASRGCHLHLVARREPLLVSLAERLQNEYGVSVHCHALDLTDPDAASNLCARLASESISVVVNNAGFALAGPFDSRPWQRISSMIDLNIRFLTAFCHGMLPLLKQRPETCRILNLGSIAGYQGVHNLAAYAASKAYVNIFSESLNWELRGSNIIVTCLQPGSTASEFFKVAEMEGSLMSRVGVMSARSVALVGVKAMIRGRASVVAGLFNKLKIFSLRLSPRWSVREVIRFLFNDLSR